MATETKTSSPAPARDDDELTRAQALQTQLAERFARLLASQGLSHDDVTGFVRRVERDPQARRVLDNARRDACGPAVHPSPTHVAPALPTNPRALRV